ncbi:MAG: hypothetical protein JOY68_07950 [Candidatus Dormibacteraeota bacterium]|nr:hypothetical protein [Candidatus Dormibacteraeota bacterium]
MRPAIDPRVAGSPATALRFNVDAHAADIESEIGDAERRLIEATAHRANLMQQLRRNEAARRQALANGAVQPASLVRTLHDGLAAADELSRSQVTVASLKARLERLSQDRELFRRLAQTLRQATPAAVALDERAGRLNQASRSIFQILEAEHDHMARQVLDGPMQRLAEACFEAELVERVVDADRQGAAEHAALCRGHASAAAAELDALAGRLRPVSLHRTLVEALQGLAAASGEHEVRLRVLGAERRLPLTTELALFRIVEEAVDNATRHGGSQRIEVVLGFHPERVSLVVKDDGEGFDVIATEARLGRTRGLGLIKMQEHAAMVGSKLEVRSLTGAGTEVRATVAHRA